LIRRFREHAAKQNWLSVAIDFVIVALGVFMGIQASNWNQARLDRVKGSEYRGRLADELKATETAMRGLESYADAAGASGRAALAVLDDPKAHADGKFLVDAYQASQIVPRGARHATYDEIIASGHLEEVGPPALRTQISNYYWRMDGILSLDSGSSTYREKLRTAMPNLVQQAIRSRCDERLVDEGNGLIVASLPKQCDARIDPALALRVTSRIRSEPGLADALNRQLSALDARSLSYVKLATNARDLRLAIERH
jgi:hypothetical protein